MTAVARVYVALAVAAALAVLAIGSVVFSRRAPAPLLADAGVPSEAGEEVWCAEGLAKIEGGGCFAPPSVAGGASAPVPLLVYLHGRYSPKMLDEEAARQSRVAHLGNAKGYAVLAMRGTQGECTQEELVDMWCWPSNPRNVDHGPAFFERIKPAMAAARGRLGGAAGPNVLLGFSNGAYFAALIATRSLGPFDAIAIAHGGPVQPTHAVGTTPPVLLITADDDPSDGEMRQLDAELTREKWAHELVSREGGHALPDWDVEIALTFFARTQSERLPLVPPLQSPRPAPVRDAGADGGEADLAAAGQETGQEDGGGDDLEEETD